MKTGYDQHFKKLKQSPRLNEAILQKALKSTVPKKPKRSFPVMPMMSFLLIAGAGLLFLENFDVIEENLKNIEIGVSTAVASSETDKTTEPAKAAEPALIVEKGSEVVAKPVVVEAKKADDADYLFKLAERKKQLDQREEELNKLAEQLEKQKTEIASQLQKLEDTRSKISTTLQERIKADDSKVETLVQMYSNMKPAQAAKIFETLDEDLVIEILGRMKKKNAAEILNLIKTEKAQVFAERYTGYRTPANGN